MAKKIKYNTVEPFDSIRDMLQKAAKNMGATTLFKYKKAGKVIDVSGADFYSDTLNLGNALASRGFVKDCHIACVGANSYNWLVVYLSTLSGQNVFVPIDKDMPEKDMLNIIAHSESSVVFCDKAYLPLFNSDKEALKGVKLVACLDTDVDTSLASLIAEGEKLTNANYGEYLAATTPDDGMKLLVYTSGTTGTPKGVMLSQHNLCSAIYYGLMVETVKERCLSVLPYHHTYESVVGILVSIHKHNCICINESLRAVLPNLKLYKPVYIYIVPAFAEMFYKRVWANIEDSGKAGSVKFLIKLSNALRKVGIDLRRKFFKQIIDGFGGELRQIVCGGAPLRADVAAFFTDIGIAMENGYGITECSPLVSVNRICDNDFSSVGALVPCLKLHIDNPDEDGNGEICVKGDVVMMGYYKMPEQTAEALDNGWFHTGDLGHYSNGKLYITGRKKNLIVLDNGKNIFPEEIEEYIYAIPYVKDAVVYAIKDENGAEASLCAEAYLDMDAIPLNGKPEEVFKADVTAALKELPSYKHINKVVIRTEEFPKTTTRKIKRNAIEKKQ